MKVLITCGPTWVPIDDVRVISNVSSGEMGHLIAQAFIKKSAKVTIIEGPVTHALADKKIKIIKYRFFDELAQALKKELLKKYDIILHAAAVSDFKVKGTSKVKISSDKALTLNLVATPKLIQDIKRLSPESFLVGFKLESQLDPKNIFKTVRSLFTSSGCDLVVANTLAGGYQGFIVNADGDILSKAVNKKDPRSEFGKVVTMMKYIVLVPDGLADEPLKELGGKTPMEAAQTPHMDYLVQNGLTALTQTIPDGMPPGSDIGNLALMGYDPQKNFSGRASLEAANLGIKLNGDEVVFRCNLVTIKDEVMVDYSAGHISSDEAKNLIEDLERATDWPDVRFYPGKSYRHLMVLKTINVPNMLKVKTTPPHDIINKSIHSYLPAGLQSDFLLRMMDKSKQILGSHQINKLREGSGENPANMIWLWGQGARPELPLFKDRYGLSGAVISAVDLVNGIGRLAGLEVIDVPGANGYYDTNYKGKGEYALNALKKHDFVYVHVEATDEAGHNGDWEAKVRCCEHFDREIVGPMIKSFGKPEGVRILVCPDHPTPVARRVHDRAPVPFAMWGEGIAAGGARNYSEKEAASKGLKFKSGEEMIQFFLRRD